MPRLGSREAEALAAGGAGRTWLTATVAILRIGQEIRALRSALVGIGGVRARIVRRKRALSVLAGLTGGARRISAGSAVRRISENVSALVAA